MQHLHDMKSVANKYRIRKILPDRFRIRRRQVRGSAFDLLFSTPEFLPKFTQRIRSAPLSDMQDPSGIKVHDQRDVPMTFLHRDLVDRDPTDIFNRSVPQRRNKRCHNLKS